MLVVRLEEVYSALSLGILEVQADVFLHRLHAKTKGALHCRDRTTSVLPFLPIKMLLFAVVPAAHCVYRRPVWFAS